MWNWNVKFGHRLITRSSCTTNRCHAGGFHILPTIITCTKYGRFAGDNPQRSAIKTLKQGAGDPSDFSMSGVVTERVTVNTRPF